ncbi:VOC family protein [Martelella sp. HB161492]|uniref:VOC family protein n=1 Tax=Martelella sp. HB161492 TaxID=2720726 RepID=UPI0015917E9E|nr:VOC family protein [Martelella sp. HB161492]
MLLELHHIQLAMPEGREQDARAFYCDILGLKAVEKPEELRHRGGCWFESGQCRIHLGVETPFRPAKKAHPAFRVRALAQIKARLRDCQIGFASDIDLPGIRRIYIADPFGNRIELLEVIEG